MLGTLRRRLILSHIVPLLVVIPLVGITLIYTIETQVLLPSLSQELRGQAALVEEMTRDQPGVWTDRSQAAAFVDRVRSRVSARVMLLDANGLILASSDPADAPRIGQLATDPDLRLALNGQTAIHTEQSRATNAEIADVLLPSFTQDGGLGGIVRLSYRLTTVFENFLRLRFLILAVLAAGLILGAVVGLAVAVDTQRPLQQATRAIDALAGGQTGLAVPETGPEEIRVLAHSFNSLAARLHSLEESRRMLLANLVHELRRPLGALLSAVQALDRGAEADPALRQELLAGMAQQIHGLQRLVEDLAQVRRQVVGSLELDRQPIQLSQWLPAAVRPWRERTEEKGLVWKAMIPLDLPGILADPDRLAEVLNNLLANAIKYTPPPGNVTVDAGSDAESAWIRVSDTGPGIAPEEQDRIFEPFYRGTAASRFPQGMGLGLGIARNLVTAHGGQLTLERVPGLGSRFIIRLPCPRGADDEALA
jgi:two-component system, OmpR family, sensor histidine kinase BaeS